MNKVPKLAILFQWRAKHLNDLLARFRCYRLLRGRSPLAKLSIAIPAIHCRIKFGTARQRCAGEKDHCKDNYTSHKHNIADWTNRRKRGDNLVINELDYRRCKIPANFAKAFGAICSRVNLVTTSEKLSSDCLSELNRK